MKRFTLYSLAFLAIGYSIACCLKEDYSLPVPDLAKSYGYPCEVHTHPTKDYYINTLHRITPKPNVTPNGKVVFLHHGLLSTASDFVLSSPSHSLGFYLADQGYDVWLGNSRGNKYSRGHEKWTTDDKRYWQFSWDQMGKYDIPASIDYILNTTNRNSLAYVGHSMGSTIFWVALDENPDLNDKIDVMIALGPVAKVEHIKSPVKYLAPIRKYIEDFFDEFANGELIPYNWFTELLATIVCDEIMLEYNVCGIMAFLLTGFDEKQINKTMIPYIRGHQPGGTSARTLCQYAQLYESGKFCRYDFGSIEANMEAYNSSVPPNYDLSSVKAPVALFWGDNDWLADPEDVKFLIDGLPNIVDNYEAPYPAFNHVDFIYGLDAPALVFNPILKLLKKYQQS